MNAPLPLRPMAGPLPLVRILDAAALAADPGVWDDLFVRALAPHPHYGRHVVAAHRAAGLAPERLACVAVGEGRRLDALLPFRLGLDLTGLGGLVAQPFLSPFVTSSAPLAAAEGVENTLAALVAGLAQASGGRPWRWPLLTVSDSLGQALLHAFEAAGWGVAVVARFERPVLERRASHDAFEKTHPRKNRLKDLRRRRRRLEEGGRLTFTSATGGAALEGALARFLDLEKAGWKGQAGTALACRPQNAAFARALFASPGGPVSARADELSLDGRPLAISLALVAGGSACLLKTAYDERERANAPGLVLEAEIVRALHETGFAHRLDSATLAGSALESLYPDRETVAEIIAVPPGGGRLVSLERRVALARFEHRAKAQARRLLRRD